MAIFSQSEVHFFAKIAPLQLFRPFGKIFPDTRFFIRDTRIDLVERDRSGRDSSKSSESSDYIMRGMRKRPDWYSIKLGLYYICFIFINIDNFSVPSYVETWEHDISDA